MLARSLLLAALIFTVGCDRLEQIKTVIKGPEQAVKGFMDARIRGGAVPAYDFLSSSDRRTISTEEWRRSSPVPVSLSDPGYRIVAIDRGWSTAVAVVEVTHPGETHATQERWDLVREPEGWMIFLDAERQAKVNALLAEAKDHRDHRRYIEAIETYDRILELDGESVAAVRGAQAARREKAEWEEKLAYIPKVAIVDLKARRYDTYGGEVPGVRFNVRNEGDRPLKWVGVTVSYEDDAGAPLYQKGYHAVFVHTTPSGHSYGTPLEPGAEWQQPSDRFFNGKEVPSSWQEGFVSARVTNLEFN